MGAKSPTLGYKYYLSLLSGLCRGPIDALVTIKVGEEIAWEGEATGANLEQIDKPDLFGGEKKEGGIQGPFRLFQGAANQVLPGKEGRLPAVKLEIGGKVSEMRGVVALWFDGLVSAMNPYLKPWSFRVRRTISGWQNDDCWYPEKARIVMGDGLIHAMNGAHIIYQCCTDPAWARGLDRDVEMDDNALVRAANQLCEEGFGICLVWYRKDDLDNFIKKVLDLIGGVLYTDRETGRTVLRLVRDDYDVADLPVFTPTTGLLEITEDDTGSADSGYNEVIGTGRDPITNKDFQMRAQNLAAYQSQRTVSSLDQDYKGVPTKEMLARLVLRDLRASAAGLKRYTVVLDRAAWRIAPGMPFRIQHPARNIGDVVLRAGEIDDGDMLNGRITIKAVQDVFGLPATSYVDPVVSEWTPPAKVALPPPESRLVEAGYRDAHLRVGSVEAEGATADEGYVGQLAVTPNSTTYQYDLATRAAGEEFEVRVTGAFTGTAVLAAAVDPLDTAVVFADMQSLTEENVGQALLLGDEIVLLDALDEETGAATVARGCADTLPALHAALARCWTIDDDLVTDERSYARGEQVDARVLSRTSSDVLDIAVAQTQTVEIVGRISRPYPPADVQVDALSIYAVRGESVEPVITWATRNRLTQADQLLGHSQGSVVSEEGVLHRVVIRSLDGVPLGEGTTVDSTFTYTTEMQATDGDPTSVRIKLDAIRGDVESLYAYEFVVVLKSGYGYGYGLNYGGSYGVT